MGHMKNLAIDNVLESLPQATDSSNGTVPEAFCKVLATQKPGSNPKIVIDDLCLALLLNTMYGQRMLDADWNEQRGDMLVFADNPTIRTCVGLWEQSKRHEGNLTTIERYLFNLLDYETSDLFHDIDEILYEKGYLKAIPNEA